MTSDPRPDDPFRSGPAAEPFSQPVAPVTRPSDATGAPARRRGGGVGILVNLLLGLALVVAVGGVAFAIGRATAPSTLAANGPAGGQFGNGIRDSSSTPPRAARRMAASTPGRAVRAGPPGSSARAASRSRAR